MLNAPAVLNHPRPLRIFEWLEAQTAERWVFYIATCAAVLASVYSFRHGYIVAYGDAESHLNIAKRVVDSLTPGFAQLGGIWLPLPHLLLVPFVYFDSLWRTGLAGSIVSGICFVISSVYLYKLIFLWTKHGGASLVGTLVFVTNPNILYLQTTPMTEPVLIVFFILSSYYFVKFLLNEDDLVPLLLAAAFGFCAALSRYDGWSLVLMEAGVLVLMHLPWRRWPKSFSQVKSLFDRGRWQQLEGRLILFSTLAFFGVALWLLWDYLILGDALYFTHSTFSASSQQHGWLAKGELPAYHHLLTSLQYYLVTTVANVGWLVFVMAALGFLLLLQRGQKYIFFLLLVLLVPFIFNVATLYLGQSVIFLPQLTPASFGWQLFNVRYGVMMVPMLAFCIAYLFYGSPKVFKALILIILMVQLWLFASGRAAVITLADGTQGLSSEISKLPDAQFWFAEHYDHGLVLLDDYARTISIIRTPIPMQDVIYVGNKPYWDQSLKQPEKYATWIIMQKNDDVWNNIYEKSDIQGRLFKYFQKVYTSPEILIFKRNSVPVNAP